MAKSKTGTACVAHRGFRVSDWADLARPVPGTRQAKQTQAQSIVENASRIVGKAFDPGEFVLSHATIVASVTTETAPAENVPIIPAVLQFGSGFDPRTIFNLSGQGGFKPNRVYPDYRITRATQKFINDNNDAFSSGVLKKSYRTFVGAENFLEHCQIAALSKGKILDSAIRDVGETFYVDILVATHRSHEELCQGILDGTVDKMSMGCDIVASQCSCCGHWSADDSELCPCIRNFKGQTFIDIDGQPSRIGELCGHELIDPTGGVMFKEASWVEGPAFKGAVSRNILEPPGGASDPSKSWHHRIPSGWTGQTGRSAHVIAEGDDFELPPMEAESDSSSPAKPHPLDDAVDQVQQYIYDQAVSRIRDRMDQKTLRDTVPGAPDDNDNITKLASLGRFVTAVRKSAQILHRGQGEEFLVRCGIEMSKPLTKREAEWALRIARSLKP